MIPTHFMSGWKPSKKTDDGDKCPLCKEPIDLDLATRGPKDTQWADVLIHHFCKLQFQQEKRNKELAEERENPPPEQRTYRRWPEKYGEHDRQARKIR